jgi:hypothetical protein
LWEKQAGNCRAISGTFPMYGIHVQRYLEKPDPVNPVPWFIRSNVVHSFSCHQSNPPVIRFPGLSGPTWRRHWWPVLLYLVEKQWQLVTLDAAYGELSTDDAVFIRTTSRRTKYCGRITITLQNSSCDTSECKSLCGKSHGGISCTL